VEKQKKNVAINVAKCLSTINQRFYYKECTVSVHITSSAITDLVKKCSKCVLKIKSKNSCRYHSDRQKVCQNVSTISDQFPHKRAVLVSKRPPNSKPYNLAKIFRTCKVKTVSYLNNIRPLSYTLDLLTSYISVDLRAKVKLTHPHKLLFSRKENANCPQEQLLLLLKLIDYEKSGLAYEKYGASPVSCILIIVTF
jgi:hypothetical protein